MRSALWPATGVASSASSGLSRIAAPVRKVHCTHDLGNSSRVLTFFGTFGIPETLIYSNPLRWDSNEAENSGGIGEWPRIRLEALGHAWSHLLAIAVWWAPISRKIRTFRGFNRLVSGSSVGVGMARPDATCLRKRERRQKAPRPLGFRGVELSMTFASG